MSILDRIRIVRQKLTLNQGEFAKRLGLTQTTMSQIEGGKAALTEKNIKLICATFALDERWLRTGEGGMFAAPSPYEKELVGLFGQLTDGSQEFILEMVRVLLEKQEKEPGIKHNEGPPADTVKETPVAD